MTAEVTTYSLAGKLARTYSATCKVCCHEETVWYCRDARSAARDLRNDYRWRMRDGAWICPVCAGTEAEAYEGEDR